MDKAEEKPNNTRKSLISAVALVAALLLLMYAAPMLQEKLREWSEKQQSEQDVEGPDEVESQASPKVSSELVSWLPQVETQLPKNEDGSAKYRILHMRLSEDGKYILLDLKEAEGDERFDHILARDKFGRYLSQGGDIAIKLYPPN